MRVEANRYPSYFNFKPFSNITIYKENMERDPEAISAIFHHIYDTDNN